MNGVYLMNLLQFVLLLLYIYFFCFFIVKSMTYDVRNTDIIKNAIYSFYDEATPIERMCLKSDKENNEGK